MFVFPPNSGLSHVLKLLLSHFGVEETIHIREVLGTDLDQETSNLE
jgi:hypothetical protein